VIDILSTAPVPLLNPREPDGRKGGVKKRSRPSLAGKGQERFLFLPVDQKALNHHFDEAFSAAGWEWHPYVTTGETGPRTRLRADFKADRLQVEVQFGNMARWYTDVFKFQLSYAQDLIDVAILVVAKQSFANLIDENIAHFERVVRELPWAKMSLTLPVLVIGIEPDDYAPIHTAYEQAFRTLQLEKKRTGGTVAMIPYSERLQMVDEDEGSVD
jgi:hypothetical protein